MILGCPMEAKRKWKNENYVRDELKSWVREFYPGCPVEGPVRHVTSFKGKRHPLTPDIDVAVGISRDELIGYEIKTPKGRKLTNYEYEGGEHSIRGYAPGVRNTIRSLKAKGIGGIKEERIQTLFQAGSDPEIYKGIGEVLFLLRYVDRAYLVLPRCIYYFMKPQQAQFLDTLIKKEFLPIGLIVFSPAEEGGLEFRQVHAARKLDLWKVNDVEAKLCGNIRDRILEELFESKDEGSH